MGAQSLRKKARSQGGQVLHRDGPRTLSKDIAQTAGALVGVGKSALADVLHRQASATSYLLYDDHLEVIRPTSSRSVLYSDISEIMQKDDQFIIKAETVKLTIKPYAYISSGRIRVPVGWLRNGIEVPYELIAEEIAARAKIEVSS